MPDTTSPFTSLIRFRPKPGRERDFEAAFEATGMSTRPRAIDGFLGARLVRSTGEPIEYVVIGEWRTPADYAAWQERSGRDADPDAFRRLLDSLVDPKPGRLYAPVEAGRDDGSTVRP